MFNKKNGKALNLECERLMEEMRKVQVGSKEYADLLEKVERLNKIKADKKGISPDTAFTVTAMLLQTIFVLKHEELHVIAGKAWGLLPRWRV